MTNSQLTLALPRGRILKESLPLLAAAGIEMLAEQGNDRRLIFETTATDVRILIIRAADVPTFVSYGAADVGVVGKDVLLENDTLQSL